MDNNEGSPVSLQFIARSDTRREGSSRAISFARPLSVSPRRMSLPHSKDVSKCDEIAGVRSTVAQVAESPHRDQGSNGISSSVPMDRSNVSDNHGRSFLCNNCDEWIIIKDIDGNDNTRWSEHAVSCAYRSVPRDISPSVAGDPSTSISETPAPTVAPGQSRDTNTAFRRRKVKHFESERLAFFQKDPQAEEVQAYRVLCGFCDKWVQLRKDRPYCPIAWTAHKLQCVSRRRSKNGHLSKKVKRENPNIMVSAAPVEATYPPPTVQIRRTEGERLRFLESDPHATTVEPHRILCGICHRWIQLRKNSTYCTAPWVQHVKKCAAKHDASRRINGAPSTHPPDEECEDQVESEAGNSQRNKDTLSTPVKRRPGRPRKRKLGVSAENDVSSFATFGPSPSPSNYRQGSRPSSASPPARTPSPALAHPYPHDLYWYPALPPMSSYYPLYAGSQFNEGDDSYSLYFHAQPPHPSSPTFGQGRFRFKPSKQISTSVPLGSPPLLASTTGSPGPDGSSYQSRRAWIVWRLKDYSANHCPMDHLGAPEPHTSAQSEASVSGSSSEPLPMYRSGTWPHLLDPEDPRQRQNLSPYIHPESGTEHGGSPGAHPGHYKQLPPPPPRPPIEDPAPVTFNSSAHIPIRKNDTYAPRPPPTSDLRRGLTMPPQPSTMFFPPDAPTGPDLDSPECRLAFTFKTIAYLFNTSYQGADDMSLDTLMTFLNRTIPHDKMYDGQEVSQHVAILGERKQLAFTKEGGVQLLGSPE